MVRSQEKPLTISDVAMNKKLCRHFNPEVHKIESKIATVRTSHHCKYNINYHIIWIPKYRKPVLVDKVKEVLKQSLKGNAKRYIQEQMGKDIFEYDIYGCPTELKGQLTIRDFTKI